jgi:hypothetical protein
MANDLTKPSNHIIWLWTVISSLAIACFSGYVALRDRDECLSNKINLKEKNHEKEAIHVFGGGAVYPADLPVSV